MSIDLDSILNAYLSTSNNLGLFETSPAHS